MKLEETLNEVRDLQSFLRFVEALKLDREDEIAKEAAKPSPPYGPGANGWENGTIENFLDAAVAWARASSKEEIAGLNVMDGPEMWRFFADFLHAGKHHE